MAKSNKSKPQPKAAKSAKTAKSKAPKPALKKPAAKAKPAGKPALKPSHKPAVKSSSKPASKAPAQNSSTNHKPVRVDKAAAGKSTKPAFVSLSSRFLQPTKPVKPAVLTPFLKEQQKRLLYLRDAMLDSMAGVAKDNLRSRAEGSEASAFGMHQADAGSDAYDRDFALNLLSQEQDALYEINEAIKRLDLGSYGNCELCNKPIPQARLEVIPFTRFTVDCQSRLEKERKLSRSRQPVTSLFGLTDDEDGAEGEEEEKTEEPKE